MPANPRQIMGPWEWYRKFALVGSVLLVLFVCIAVSVPYSIGFVILLALASEIWKKLDMTNPVLGTYVPGTPPHKVAMFFLALKQYRKVVYAPVVALGLGPTTPDPDHALQPGFFPPTRLAGYWSIIASLILALPEAFLPWIHDPFWGYRIPGIVLYVLGAVGWYACLQVIMQIRRFQAGGLQGETGYEPRPAVMLDLKSFKAQVLSHWKVSIAVGIVPAALIMVIWASTRSNIAPFGMAAIFSLGFTALATGSARIRAKYVEGWMDRKDRRIFWQNTLAFMRDANPILVGETSLPTLESWNESPHNPDDPDDIYEPLLKVAAFAYPINMNFDTYRGIEDKIAGPLQVTTVALSPIGEFDHNGNERPGTIGPAGFRIWWPLQPVNKAMLLQPDLDELLRQFLCRVYVLPILSQMRGIGNCELVGVHRLTTKDSSGTILEVQVEPPPQTTYRNFMDSIPQLEGALGVHWVRVGRTSRGAKAGSTVSVVLGDLPSSPGIIFSSPASETRGRIDEYEWSYYFYAVGLEGQAGPPRRVRRVQCTPMVDKLVFRLPEGLSFDRISSAVGNLKTTSMHQLLEVSLGDDSQQVGQPALPSGSNGATDPRPSARRARFSGKTLSAQAAEQSTLFTLIAAKRDPLSQFFEVDRYKEQLFLPREPGVPKIDWKVGITADDQFATYSWDDELPHLLIAGSSGNGKSVVVNNMVLQIAHNNAPTEAVIWAIDPKIELQTYENLDTVERLVDSWTPDTQFFYNAANLMEDAVDEMMDRYRQVRFHPKHPKKWEKAREIAAHEGPGPHGEPHPFSRPFIFIVIEECATLFSGPHTRDDKEDYERLMRCVGEIARMGRASGIYLVAITQYPTNASIPSTIRNQMRRIGLGCQNALASDIVIGQHGLEGIKEKGVGMMSIRGQYRMFRGFWLKDGDPDHGEPNDVLELLAQMPNQARTWNNGSGLQPLTVPPPSDMVFSLWDKRTGGGLQAIVSGSRKDIGDPKAAVSGFNDADKLMRELDDLPDDDDLEESGTTLHP